MSMRSAVTSAYGTWRFYFVVRVRGWSLIGHTTPYVKIALDDEEHEAESCDGLYLVTEKIKP